MIEENLKTLLESIPEYNPQGERVTLVGAVKLQTPDDINRAIRAGLRDIGDNHVQEFRDKYETVSGNPKRHFIGHLQTNKIKYLVGKVDLYHSVDRLELAEKLAFKSAEKQVVSDILIQINIGDEYTKGGFSYDEALTAYQKIKAMNGLRVRGFMAMLPNTEDTAELLRLAKKMRNLFDTAKKDDPDIAYLSMGMSGDYELCISAGSNMIRLGTAIFGERHYN